LVAGNASANIVFCAALVYFSCMKKGLLCALFFLLLLCRHATAQYHSPYAFPRKEIAPADNYTERWYSYAQLQFELGGYKQYALPIFPDSAVVNLHRDSAGYSAAPNHWYAAGICFDPKDPEYSFGSTPLEVLSKFDNFYLDSILIRYLYERQLHDVTDTLIVHLFREKYGMRYGQYSQANVFGTAPYNRSKQEAQKDSGVFEFRIPLTAKDSIFTQGKWGALAINHQLPIGLVRGSELAVTVSFKPGYSYSAGDTLYSDSLLPAKKRNVFCLRAVAYPENILRGYYNNGLFIDRKQAYSDQFQDSVLKSSFIPSSIYDTSYFPDISFRLSYLTGIEDVLYKNTLFYPNPTNGTIRLAGTNTFPLLLEVFNAQGTAVYSAQLNTRTEELNLAHLPGGIYTVKTTGTDGTLITKLIKF
jgi:hypothetical protein